METANDIKLVDLDIASDDEEEDGKPTATNRFDTMSPSSDEDNDGDLIAELETEIAIINQKTPPEEEMDGSTSISAENLGSMLNAFTATATSAIGSTTVRGSSSVLTDDRSKKHVPSAKKLINSSKKQKKKASTNTKKAPPSDGKRTTSVGRSMPVRKAATGKKLANTTTPSDSKSEDEDYKEKGDDDDDDDEDTADE